MLAILDLGRLRLVVFEGEEGRKGLAVVDEGRPVPLCYSYNPWVAEHADTLRRIATGLADGLGGSIEEFLRANMVYLGPRKGVLLGCPGLDILEALAAILANGVGVQPFLPELGRRIARILRNEEGAVLQDGRVVKTYRRFYSFSAVVKVAAAISFLEGCRLIEIRAGAKKERGPDLRVAPASGREVLVEVTVKLPSPRRLQEATSRPMPLTEFLEKVIEIDLGRLSDKLEKQRRQIQSSDCIIVAGWHSSIGLSILSAIQGSIPQTVRRVEELQGVYIHSSWISREPEHVILCVKS